jgi:S1-C subfamily serine protease
MQFPFQQQFTHWLIFLLKKIRRYNTINIHKFTGGYKMRAHIKRLFVLVLILALSSGSITTAYAAGKSISVKVNTVNIKVNGVVAKIDNFEYKGNYFIQPQDICSLLGLEYSYTAKTKTVVITNKKAQKKVSPAKAQFSGVKMGTGKNLSVQINTMVIKINGKNQTVENYLVNNAVYCSLKSLATLLGRTYGYDVKTKTVSLTDKAAAPVRKLLTKEEVSVKNVSIVKVVEYNTNGNMIGSGSGFIISADGKVVTNYHVVNMTTAMEVVTAGNKTYKVKGVLGYNVAKDLAVLQLDTADVLPFVNLGDSAGVKLGEDVVAIGYPLGIQNTVSFGNISSISASLGRKGSNDFQITSPISSGSSGGALFNMYGEVVGVTFAQIQQGQNMNFAIPINDLKPLLTVSALKTPVEVIREVYPTLSYEIMASYLASCYAPYEVNKTMLSFSNIFLEDNEENAATLDVNIHLYDDNFSSLMDVLTNNKKADAETWVKDILNEVKLYYPKKNCSLIVYLYDEYTVKPTDFPDTEITYNSSTGKYEVSSLILSFQYDAATGEATTITWDWE